MTRRIVIAALSLILICSLAACGTTGQQDTGALDVSENNSYESVEGTQIKMITENTEVVITLNDSRAAADLVAMLPLEMTLRFSMTIIYEQTIVEVIPLGHAETGAETMANESGTVRLELASEEGEQTENE